MLAPAQVQGEAAPQSIVAALNEIQKKEWRCDVVIVGRGGGSAEDLMAFNDEAVCRAIANCRVPVVSAVGRQIDHPISDDVADYAAATPTDAARAVFPCYRRFGLPRGKSSQTRLWRCRSKTATVSKILAYSDKRILGKTIRLGEERHIFSMSSNQN